MFILIWENRSRCFNVLKPYGFNRFYFVIHISLLVFQNQSKMSVIKTTIDVTFKKFSEPRKPLLGMGLMIQHLGSRRFK